MKKNLLSLLLAVVLVLGLMIVATPAMATEEETTPAAHSHCYCVNSEAQPADHVCDETIVWTGITKTTTISENGAYCLDWTGNKAASITVSKNVNAYLCLNGARIYAKATITVGAGASLTICDCVGKGSITISGSPTAGPVTMGANQTVNLYSGNITGTGNGKSLASVTLGSSTAIFNMYGGSITGGTAEKGGNVNISRGVFTMYGGTISGGKASAQGGNVAIHTAASGTSTFIMNGGTISGGTATGQEEILDPETNAVTQEAVIGQGGNVSVTASVGVFEFNGGTITGGNAANGGNIYVNAGTCGVAGGTIEGGKATINGGNIYVVAGVLNISGGVIKDGSAVNGGNIAANGDGRKVELTISGGTVQNGVATEKGGNIYLQATTNGCAFAMSDNALVTGGQAAMGGNIASYQNNPTTGLKGGTICYGAAEKGGNIYVESDAKVNTFNLNGTAVYDGMAKVVETGTDAEGNRTEKVVSGEGGNIYVAEGSKLQIASGTVTGGEAYNGGNIYVAKNATAEIAVPLAEGIAHYNGGNIYTLSELTLGAITVSGGTATVNGGNIYIEKKVLTLDGTTVIGGSANQGGNIVVRDAGAQLIATDAIIENGSAITAGGNIYTLNVPTINITGGSIIDGTAVNGGNIYSTHSSMTSTRRLTISGTHIANGVAETNGGNLYIAKVGVVKLENVTCDNGNAKENGGNVYMEGNYKINFVGGTYIMSQGGRVYDSISGDDAYKALIAQYGRNVGDTKLISEGGKRMNGNGGNICIAYSTNYVKETTDETTGETTKETTPNSTTFNGTKLIGGNAYNGGALYVGNANVSIENVTAKSCGGHNGRVLYVAKNGNVTVKDSTFVNWGTQGSTIHNHGSLSLVGAVKLDKEFNAAERKNGEYKLTIGIILDATENSNAMVDISGLTEVVNREEEGLPTVSGISMVRYGEIVEDAEGNQSKLMTPGKLATGVNDTNRGFISLGSGSVYVLTEQENDLYVENAPIQGVKDDGSLVNGGADFTEITTNHKSDVMYYIVNTNLENAGQLGVSINLDLNGKTVSDATVAEGVTLKLMDTANDGYKADKCGKIFITGNVEPIVHESVFNSATDKKESRHYVILPNEDGSVSARRYMARIAAVSLDAKNDALGFKAIFQADEEAQKAITKTGYTMGVEGGGTKTYIPEKQKPFTGYEMNMYLRLHSIMAYNGGEMKISGEAFMIFNIDGQEIMATTSAKTTTMKSAIKDVNNLTDLKDAQKAAVYSLYQAHKAIIDAWLGEDNHIKDWAPVEATA